jgi:FtsP/CotA-like multicopper oxidase with cupredoxin domain
MLVTAAATAQSFRVQCPSKTNLHTGVNDQGAIKCQQISGGDGYATMGDGHQIYLFGFGPLSGLQDIANGQPGTETASVFNNAGPNGAVGLVDATTGAVDAAPIMNVGVLNANAPAPLIAIDEDDELFLTLTNVGMIMRPDLFEQHTVHFHGYPNASSYFDGVPDASVAVNIGGSFTYYYTAPDAGTYFWHCHITPPEHLQMGMVGQLYVRPRQNRVNGNLYDALNNTNTALATNFTGVSTKYGTTCSDILCTGQTPLPAAPATGADASNDGTKKYAYNDGDGSTQYDVEYPIQMMGFDPNFHFVGMTFNPEMFADMKDKYFLLNGRSYPDTVNTTGNYLDSVNTYGAANVHGDPSPATYTQSSDGVARPAQPMPTLIQINKTGGQKRALLRLSNLSVTELSTLGTIGIPMTVIALDARLLRDTAGQNMYYNTNSITIGGGQSADVILDATNVNPGTYYLYSTNLDHLSNDAENFGGMMTEIVVQ